MQKKTGECRLIKNLRLMLPALQFAAKLSFAVAALSATKVGVLWLFMV
ncbi:hypothetical protein ymoll0001_30740 [Yersinia mollaretii ATCC 43969]|uniref:Uncharacterized protein n=1 Tax=Yersinia mollaretii (strain ATCC 43969 / DSM 18520 / CIP 103324 / CNY 7263 / WAIP 204) TaxID=349967 RepID=A0ABM9YC06_YERMW|nr:hypothetical protein ymoll0001_30740 [Yersinia mollaretii ATCC 43969]